MGKQRQAPVKHLDGAAVQDAPRVCRHPAAGVKPYVVRDRCPPVPCICECPPA